VLLRSFLWPTIFAITVVLFFALSCVVMPRLNGKRDTTGLCAKLGGRIQDRLDEKPWMLELERTRLDTWNGKLNAILAHYAQTNPGGDGKDEPGASLTEEEFVAMFSMMGDRFVEPQSYRDALETFGTPSTASESGGKVMDIAAIESIYSLGCRTWREKHVQVERDFERFKIISKDHDVEHSDFLVVTGSLGAQGLVHVNNTRASMHSDQGAVHVAGPKSVRDRAALAALAIAGGDEFASHLDEEFTVEAAMSEHERFSVTMPSLYIETWLFTMICAFLFLWIDDFTKYLLLHSFLQPNQKEKSSMMDFGTAIANFFDPTRLPRNMIGKAGTLCNIGHKVCLLHWIFISAFVLPNRLITVLVPKSSCAMKMAEKTKPKPLKERELNDEGKPLEVLITARTITLCDKIKLFPLLLLNWMGRKLVGCLKIFSIDVQPFLLVEPFLTFATKSRALQSVRGAPQTTPPCASRNRNALTPILCTLSSSAAWPSPPQLSFKSCASPA